MKYKLLIILVCLVIIFTVLSGYLWYTTKSFRKNSTEQDTSPTVEQEEVKSEKYMVVFDLDGKEISLGCDVYLKIDNSDFAFLAHFVKSGSVLAADRNANKRVDHINELIEFPTLTLYDMNRDDYITPEEFKDLCIVKCATFPRCISLKETSVNSIDLKNKAFNSLNPLIEISLNIDTLYSIYTGKHPELPGEVREKIAPFLGIKTYGYVPPFDVAVSRNPDLIGMVEKLENEKDIENRIKILENIIYKWFQVENVSPGDFLLDRFEHVKIDESKGTIFCYEDNMELPLRRVYAAAYFSGYRNFSFAFKTRGKHTLLCKKLIDSWSGMFSGIWVRYAVMSPSLQDYVEPLKYFAFIENYDHIIFTGNREEYRTLKEYLYSLLSDPRRENLQKALVLLSVMLESATTEEGNYPSELARKIIKENTVLRNYLNNSRFKEIFGETG